ncbi:MAG: aspartyl protease family protein [Aeromonas sp.]
MSLLAAFQVNVISNRKFVTVDINGQPVRLQLDTASNITIISQNLWRSLGEPSIEQTFKTATSACGGPVRLTGELHCCVSFHGTTISGSCFVSTANLNLLALDWLEQLGLADLPIRAICNHNNNNNNVLFS